MSDRRYLYWLIPTLTFLVVAALSPLVDMRIAAHFYDPSAGEFTKNGATDFIYDWGVLPAQAVGIGSLIVLLLSYVQKKWRPWRKPALMLVLTMAIGAGFITHTLLKDHWGRPRPKQVVNFGGMQEFRPVFKPNFFGQPEPSKSFPCGHCTMGFFFFALIFVGKRLRKPILTYTGIFLALSLGVALSLTRIAQGGHFFSDTVTAAAIMWLTAYACDWALYWDED